jgi:hypothetical protein
MIVKEEERHCKEECRSYYITDLAGIILISRLVCDQLVNEL